MFHAQRQPVGHMHRVISLHEPTDLPRPARAHDGPPAGDRARVVRGPGRRARPERPRAARHRAARPRLHRQQGGLPRPAGPAVGRRFPGRRDRRPRPARVGRPARGGRVRPARAGGRRHGAGCGTGGGGRRRPAAPAGPLAGRPHRPGGAARRRRGAVGVADTDEFRTRGDRPRPAGQDAAADRPPADDGHGDGLAGDARARRRPRGPGREPRLARRLPAPPLGDHRPRTTDRHGTPVDDRTGPGRRTCRRAAAEARTVR
ncbi:Hydrolase [Actinacidiphila bryophytorum]|uniref:Hydrolase n=1 Tax=Actinacidiphila bryophytorum TaxID=1436133 RepID=A0A9W4GX25_9ACTN|nr:Hydrolase [Actinacidiphila bryophytorum]